LRIDGLPLALLIADTEDAASSPGCSGAHAESRAM
jgi:hypothetical protein